MIKVKKSAINNTGYLQVFPNDFDQDLVYFNSAKNGRKYSMPSGKVYIVETNTSAEYFIRKSDIHNNMKVGK
jgi:hypothetical protein